MSDQARTITVVIPTRDEEQNIGELIRKTVPYCAEVIVMDGHSRDETIKIAKEAGATVVLDNNRGKGSALRLAAQHIRTDIAVFMDADGSHDPADIPRLTAPICDGHADHVIGSRLIGGSSELHGGFDEFMRLAGSSFITASINCRFGVRFSDSQNGFRAIAAAAFRKLELRENKFTIEQELLVQSLLKGLRTIEVPAHEHRRKFGKSHINVWISAPDYLISLIRLLFFSR